MFHGGLLGSEISVDVGQPAVEFIVASAQFFRKPYVHVPDGSGVVYDQTSVIGMRDAASGGIEG